MPRSLLKVPEGVPSGATISSFTLITQVIIFCTTVHHFLHGKNLPLEVQYDLEISSPSVVVPDVLLEV